LLPHRPNKTTCGCAVTIEQVDGPVLSIKSREGDTVKSEDGRRRKVTAMVKASMATSSQDRLSARPRCRKESGRWKAIEVHIFPEAMRGTGEGDRPSITGRKAP